MKLFARGLPAGTTSEELRLFAERFLCRVWYKPFRVTGKVKSCVVLKIKDLDLGTEEFHGLIDVQPAKTALHVTPKLNRARFRGRPLEVRKWQVRYEWNDRRRRRPPKHGEHRPPERRTGDRRRANLVIEDYVPPQFRAVKGFHRQYTS